MLQKQGRNVWLNNWSVKTNLREEICKTLASILQTNSTNLKNFKQILMTGAED